MRETNLSRTDTDQQAVAISYAEIRADPLSPVKGSGSFYDPKAVAQHNHVYTPRLVLRLVAPINAAELAAILRADAEPMLGSWAYPLDPAAALERIERTIAQTNRREALAYVFVDRATDRVAGWCSAVRWHETRDDIAMLTYWVGGEFEGRGYVAEAIRAAGPHLLAWIGTSRLGAGAYPNNERSRQTMQRAGLTTPDGIRQLWSSTRCRNEPIVCFAASREEVMSWSESWTPNSCVAEADEINRERAT